MDLKRNLFDNIKECETKIGYQKQEIGLYYPKSSLLELLDATEATLPVAISNFCQEVKPILGAVTIEETQEAGRFCITVSSEGVEYIHNNVSESAFLKALISDIRKPGNTLEGIVSTFCQFSNQVVVEKHEAHEWAIYFEDQSIDPYVYHIEEDDFGLEYHRFTHKAYELLQEEG